jgi:hypothetical protein
MIDERNNQRNWQAEFAEKRQFIKMCRRALVQRDEYAREWLQCSTQKLMQESLHNHPYYEELQRTGNEEQYVPLTFERFWQMADQQKLWLHTRSQMLRHLRATLNSLILETLRNVGYTRQKEVSPYSSISSDGHILWSIIQGLLPDERERRIAYLLYHCGLKPMEIVCTCPQECNDVQEIQRVRRVVIEKIQPFL